jgi:hypothetical protein
MSRPRVNLEYSRIIITVLLVLVAAASLSPAVSLASYSGFQATTTSSQSSVTCTSSIAITTDKSPYVVGERVKLSGFVTNAYCGFNCPIGAYVTCDIAISISLIVEDPTGQIVYSNSPSYLDPPSNFSYSNDFILPQNATAGIYTASAKLANFSNGELSSTSFLVLTSVGNAWTISLSTDKQTYQTGEPIYINGTITGGPTCPPTCSSAWIGITVWTANASGVSGGWFGDLAIPITNTTTYHFHATINTGLSAGAYSVNAAADTTGYPTIHGTTSITVENSTSPSQGGRISLKLNRQEYTLGDTVSATASYEGPIPNGCLPGFPGVVFGFYVFDSNSKQVYFDWYYQFQCWTSTSGQTTQFGAVSRQFHYVIPKNATPGLYQARLVAGFGSVQPPSTFPSGAALQASSEFSVSSGSTITTCTIASCTPLQNQTSPSSSQGGQPRCVIATAAFGSELAGPVQFLRSFRDRDVNSTHLGSSFLSAFNSWYYSWAPAVAEFEAGNNLVRAGFRVVLLPLLGVLFVSREVFVLLAPVNPEIAILAAGIVASGSLGLVYLMPIVVTIPRLARKRITRRTILGIGVLGFFLTIWLTFGYGSSEPLQLVTALTVVEAVVLSPVALLQLHSGPSDADRRKPYNW